MDNTVTASTVHNILKRNGYTVEASSNGVLRITKSNIKLANLLLPLLLPLPFLVIGLLELYTGEEDILSFLLLVVLPTWGISRIIKVNFKKFRSVVVIDQEKIVIIDRNKQLKINFEDVEKFITTHSYGEIRLALKNSIEPVLAFQLVNLNAKYLKDDMEKTVDFLNSQYTNAYGH